jgi:hypothetical protein
VRPSPGCLHLGCGCYALGEARPNSHKLFVPSRPVALPPSAPRSPRGRRGAGNKAAGWTGRVEAESAARCGAQANVKVTPGSSDVCSGMESEAKFEVLGERGTRVSVGWYPLSLKSGLQGRLPPGGVVLAKWKESGKRVQTGGLDDVHALTN